jgi:hypothetical protein
MAPLSWNWPVGASISFEGGFVKDGYDPDTWTLEIRPIIDRKWGPVYLALNPVIDLTFKGADAGRGPYLHRTLSSATRSGRSGRRA